ncbi:Uncharacterized conserved protein, DUF885 familyt [Paraoerskovia marina]|uniref:Uncharacterized conserved protein, DUF885 familyt n=1 Tax=Paraoerskovia marina TaxID=545619 RepID=A0A1H1UJ19_9CELL|nr:DUF885 domain-containing protein [Paraoerskovia marina]SDS72492.1 Uncharacterized conserved protein, DUF885 familyt [Paraoerskovia marina]
MTDQERTPTPVDTIAERHVRRVAELDPIAATAMGLPGHDDRLTDLSPDGLAQRAQATRTTLRELDAVAPVDDTDRVTLAAMRERLGLELELHEAGEDLRELNNIESPLQRVRDIFDLQPTASVEDWEAVRSRLEAVPEALGGYARSLREAAARGDVAAHRQVVVAAGQARELAGPDSFFRSFVAGSERVLDDSGACQLLRGDLDHAARTAAEAYGELAEVLETELAPQAPLPDAVGRERYSLWSRWFLGARVDLDETYAWGVAELDRVIAEQEATAREVAGPQASIADAVALLDADPDRRLVGTEALRRWMQETSDAAIDALDGVHFDIPEAVRTLECRIAPTQTGGIYYTPPSDDFSRPGQMWWSVPPDVTEHSTWMERTTVYHEGVPGHHLQCGQAVHDRGSLNSWRRLACWVSGHGEGWALYAERLMADLGHLDDPGDRLGMLDAQRLRAARVVVDLGVHLGLEVPRRWGSGRWDADTAWTFLRENVALPEASLRFELDRYLGWPGQAPSYKIGQRLWERTRDEARAASADRGEDFSLKRFHARALGLGSVGLDVLRTELGR